MNNNIELLSYSGLTIVMWGLWGFWGKLALDKGMAPLGLFVSEVLVTILCGAVIFVMLMCFPSCMHGGTSWNTYGLLSALCLKAGLIFFYVALSKGKASLVVPLTAVYPIIPAFMGFTLLGDKLTLVQMAGVAFVIIGTMCIVSA